MLFHLGWAVAGWRAGVTSGYWLMAVAAAAVWEIGPLLFAYSEVGAPEAAPEGLGVYDRDSGELIYTSSPLAGLRSGEYELPRLKRVPMFDPVGVLVTVDPIEDREFLYNFVHGLATGDAARYRFATEADVERVETGAKLRSANLGKDDMFGRIAKDSPAFAWILRVAASALEPFLDYLPRIRVLKLDSARLAARLAFTIIPVVLVAVARSRFRRANQSASA